MPSESLHANAPAANRTIIVPLGPRVAAYACAFTSLIGSALFFSGLMKSPEHRILSHDEILLLIPMLCPFVAWSLFLLHRAVARIDIDGMYISTVSLLGTRKSAALRDIASDFLLTGAEGHKILQVKTTGGKRLEIPDLLFSEDQLRELREDLAKRVRHATGQDIPTRPPPEPDRWVTCFFVVLLPLVAVIVINLVHLIGAHLP